MAYIMNINIIKNYIYYFSELRIILFNCGVVHHIFNNNLYLRA